MAAIELVKKHYASLGTRSIRVPEWDNLEIFVKPFTLGEQSELYQVQTVPKRSQFDLYAATIIIKARDANGNRLFADADIKAMMGAADQAVVERVATEIVEVSKVDDLKKSSETT